MRRYTHFLAGVLSAVIVLKGTNIKMMLLGGVFGVLQDVDVLLPVQHRSGLTHSLFSVILLPLPIFLYTHSPSIALIAFFAFLSHWLLDAMNPSGVMLFPSKKITDFLKNHRREFRLASISYDDQIANLLFSLTILVGISLCIS